jgi:hypothetical protein
MQSITTTSPKDLEMTSESSLRIFDSGGLGWSGFFGGPLAISYLIYRDLRALGHTDLLPKVAVWFIPCILFWLYCLLSFPRDLVSQWILYLPQTILWWILARHLLGKIQADFAIAGGKFRTRWAAVRLGFFTFLGMKLFFYVVGALGWAG